MKCQFAKKVDDILLARPIPILEKKFHFHKCLNAVDHHCILKCNKCNNERRNEN